MHRIWHLPENMDPQCAVFIAEFEIASVSPGNISLGISQFISSEDVFASNDTNQVYKRDRVKHTRSYILHSYYITL